MSNGSTSAAKPPLKEIRVGGVSAAIWEQNGSGQQGNHVRYSVRISKSYRDKKTNEYRTTEYYFPTDLPKLILAAEKAFEYVSLKTSSNEDDSASDF